MVKNKQQKPKTKPYLTITDIRSVARDLGINTKEKTRTKLAKIIKDSYEADFSNAADETKALLDKKDIADLEKNLQNWWRSTPQRGKVFAHLSEGKSLEYETKPLPFSITPNEILDAKDLNQTEERILIYIASFYINDKSCYAKNLHLADKFNRDVKQIKKAISNLKIKGYLKSDGWTTRRHLLPGDKLEPIITKLKIELRKSRTKKKSKQAGN